MPSRKRLFFDIETSPNIGFFWQAGYDLKVTHECIIEERAIICVCWKWAGQAKVHSLQWDGDQSDKALLKAFMPTLLEADEAIGHNGDRFDIPWLRTRCLFYDIPFPPQITTIDTLKAARGKFNFNSNKLDYIGKYLGLGGKAPTGGFDTWKDIKLKNCPKAMVRMVKYCISSRHKLLRSDMRWIKARDLAKGDIVLGFDEDGKHKAYKRSKIKSIQFEKREVYKVRLGSGKVFLVTPEHKWLVSQLTAGRTGNYEWKTTEELKMQVEKFSKGQAKYPPKVPRLFEMWDEDYSKEAGWLAGMYDGEGTLSKSRFGLTIAQNPGPTQDKILRLLERFYKNCGKKVNMPNSDCEVIWLKGSLFERMHLLGTIRPERLIAKVDFNKLGRLECRNLLDSVISVETWGLEEIAIIETSTGTFVCDGYPMHNCKQDVRLLEQIFDRMNSYLPAKTSTAKESHHCPECGGENAVVSKTRVTAAGYKQAQLVCKDCGKYNTVAASRVPD